MLPSVTFWICATKSGAIATSPNWPHANCTSSNEARLNSQISLIRSANCFKRGWFNLLMSCFITTITNKVMVLSVMERSFSTQAALFASAKPASSKMIVVPLRAITASISRS